MKKNSEIKQLDDISLLEYLCNSKSDIAYNEFIHRYYNTVKDRALLKCKQRKLDSHIGEEIAHKVFEKVLKTNSFKRKRLNGHDPVKAITGWLYTILINEFYDYHRSVKRQEEPPQSYFDELTSEFTSVSADKLFDQKEFALTIFKNLNKKEQEVITTDSEIKRVRKYLPQEVNESLADKLGVKPATIRKIRERAINKIKLAIDEYNN